MIESEPKRRWFSFSIRDLLWLTVVAAICVTWRIGRSQNSIPRLSIVRLFDTKSKKLTAAG